MKPQQVNKSIFLIKTNLQLKKLNYMGLKTKLYDITSGRRIRSRSLQFKGLVSHHSIAGSCYCCN